MDYGKDWTAGHSDGWRASTILYPDNANYVRGYDAGFLGWLETNESWGLDEF